ncbi:MAG: hypothetical protein ACM31D_04685 [Bacteroidota bacterium]
MTPRSAFVAPDQVSVYQVAGWTIVPGEKRKVGPGVWHVLMAAPPRLPMWWRLRVRLGLGGACSAINVHGCENKPADRDAAPSLGEMVP